MNYFPAQYIEISPRLAGGRGGEWGRGGAAEKPNTLAFIVLIWDYIVPLGRAHESHHGIARQLTP